MMTSLAERLGYLGCDHTVRARLWAWWPAWLDDFDRSDVWARMCGNIDIDIRAGDEHLSTWTWETFE